MRGWMYEGRDVLFSLTPIAETINGTICKKCRERNANDKKCFDKKLAKRRKRNKNLKTHRR